jgi:outer membrane protein TolC
MTARHTFPRRFTLAAAALALAGLSGCASVNFEQSLAQTNAAAADFTQGALALAQTPEQREARAQTALGLLQTPLDQTSAVRLALVNSPALQAMLAQQWADAANAAQNGHVANPVFTLERIRFADELDIGRLLTFGLLDLLTLPQRYGMAQRQLAQAQLRLTLSVVDQLTQVRGAWVKAVAAQQTLTYARQVNDAAKASAELARRMQAAGNFTKLQRARQQAFYADAAVGWAAAQHTSRATREELVRLLGLTAEHAASLRLPERLPDLPSEPRAPEEVGQQASRARLDIRLAQAEYETAAKAQGLNTITSFTDIEFGVRRDTVFQNPHDGGPGTASPRRGNEISVRLPLFDWGGARRDAMNAQTLAAANRLDATTRAAGSHLRESYSAYRTAYDLSRHYRDEVVPLRKTISEENVLRYNGMLIGVFELLADSRDQVGSVMGAIAAEQQFWLADAALQATLMGKPMANALAAMPSRGTPAAAH